MSQENRVYFKGLDGLRAIGALSVVLGHIELSKGSIGASNLMHLPFYKNTSGHLGVMLFFVLSGFLISYLLFKEKQETKKIDVIKFYKRRALRIWPIYYLTIVLLFFVFPFIIEFEYFAKPNWENPISNVNTILIYFLMVPNFVSFGINGLGGGFQLGSIGTEEQFYLFWPWVVKYFRNILYPIFALIVLIPFVPHFCDYAIIHFFPNESFMFIFLNQLGDFFVFFKINCMAIGGLCAWIYFHQKNSILNFLYSKYVQIVVLILSFGGWIFGFHFNYFNDEYYSLLFAVLILNTATNPNAMISFNSRLLNYLGKISYGIYVYHWIIIYFILDTIMPLKSNFWLFNIILYSGSLLISILISHFSYHYFEISFLKLKEKFSIVQSNKKI